MKRIDRMLAWVIQFAGGTAQQQRQRDSGLTVWDFCDSAEEREIQAELEKIRAATVRPGEVLAMRATPDAKQVLLTRLPVRVPDTGIKAGDPCGWL